MQRQHEDRPGGAASNGRYARWGASRAGVDPVRDEFDPERDGVWRAAATGIRDPARTGELVVGSDRRAEGWILSLSGELDLVGSALLERELDYAEATRPMRLVVDLTGLEFIDSSGLHTLMQAHQRASENGHQLSLRPGPRSVQRLFELTDTVHLFSFDD